MVGFSKVLLLTFGTRNKKIGYDNNDDGDDNYSTEATIEYDSTLNASQVA